jgi:hypothetical protein
MNTPQWDPWKFEEPPAFDVYVHRAAPVVHLRRADYDDPTVRASWQAQGFATLGPVEGHDPYVRCPICSTDPQPPPDLPGCGLCGQGPCWLTGQARVRRG